MGGRGPGLVFWVRIIMLGLRQTCCRRSSITEERIYRVNLCINAFACIPWYTYDACMYVLVYLSLYIDICILHIYTKYNNKRMRRMDYRRLRCDGDDDGVACGRRKFYHCVYYVTERRVGFKYLCRE